MNYYERDEHGIFTPTDRRPTDVMIARLTMKAAEIRRSATRHAPGAGMHYVPSDHFLYINTNVPSLGWAIHTVMSSGAVLAHADDLCAACGLDFAVIYNGVFAPFAITLNPACDLDPRACARPATKADRLAVLGDLEACGFTALATAINAALWTRQRYLLVPSGSISDADGDPIYTAADLSGFSVDACLFLAELHSVRPDLAPFTRLGRVPSNPLYL